MKLSKLTENLGFNSLATEPNNDVVIAGLSLDSRQEMAGNLFAALKGEVHDGREFIASAIENGARAILLETGSEIDAKLKDKALFLEHDNPRLALAKMAGRFYSPHPSHCVAVTGTNGKTSVASFVRQIWKMLGHSAASMGTMGIESDKVKKSGGLTTPDTIAFHKNMSELAKAGVDHVVFEASSHGLCQHRMDGVEVKVAAFTNLSHEHLDYHGTIENYFAAKCKLFTDILSTDGIAVINIDGRWGLSLAELCRANNIETITIGKSESAVICLANCQASGNGYVGEVKYQGKAHGFTLPLMGQFQVENALLALGIVLAGGANISKAIKALAKLEGVAGRMELAGVSPTGGRVFIDYAHTPDGLENALASLQDIRTRGRLMVVFGCGGNRDKAKRPIMGAIANKLADKVFITDDNPRNENPATIRAEVLSGAEGAFEFDDRGVAIKTAVGELQADDVLLVTGKGHERGQIVAAEVLPFSDLEVVQEAILKCDNEGVKS